MTTLIELDKAVINYIQDNFSAGDLYYGDLEQLMSDHGSDLENQFFLMIDCLEALNSKKVRKQAKKDFKKTFNQIDYDFEDDEILIDSLKTRFLSLIKKPFRIIGDTYRHRCDIKKDTMSAINQIKDIFSKYRQFIPIKHKFNKDIEKYINYFYVESSDNGDFPISWDLTN